MKRFGISFLIVIVLLQGCGLNMNDVSQLKQMKSYPISFPSSLRMTINGEFCDFCKIPDGVKLIVYVDSSMCNSCITSKLEVYHGFEHFGDGRLNVVYVLNPKEEELELVLHELTHYEEIFPVYVDLRSDFLKTNGRIPRDSRFHTFLVDSLNYPVFVGDPTKSEKMIKTFNSVLHKLI